MVTGAVWATQVLKECSVCTVLGFTDNIPQFRKRLSFESCLLQLSQNKKTVHLATQDSQVRVVP
jgi:hypothetical protein